MSKAKSESPPVVGLSPETMEGLRSLDPEMVENRQTTPSPGEAPPEPKAKEWREVTDQGVLILAEMASNWTFSPLARTLISQGLAECLDKIWPGGLANFEKWAPYAKLLAGIGIAGLANFDWKANKLKPLQLKKVNNEAGKSDGRGGSNTDGKDVVN